MLILLPAIAFIGGLAFLYARMREKSDTSLREAFLLAALAFGLLVIAITETLSLFNLIGALSMAIVWGVIALACTLLALNSIAGLKIRHIRPGRFEAGMLLGLFIITFFIWLTGLLYPPNNWDSMTYHMGRVVHWIQDGNVNYYATNIERQLYSSPFAEYVILNFQLLSGGDRFAYMVQFFSMLASVAGASLVAKKLGGNARAQLIAAVVCATIPMGILQASSTQNDYVVSAALISFAYFILKLRDEPGLYYSLAAGASLGIAIFTKQTAYVFAMPFIIWLSISAFRRGWNKKEIAAVKKWGAIFLIVLLTALAINVGYFARNLALYGNPMASNTPGQSTINEAMNIPGIVSNLVRNVGLHLGTISWISGHVNPFIYGVANYLHFNLNDPAATFGNSIFFIGSLSTHEDYAGNLLFLLLFIVVSLVIIANAGNASRSLLHYFGITLLGFLIFSIALKWQPWGSRLQLPFFVIAAPLVGVVITKFFSQKIVMLVMALLILSSAIWVFSNVSRPLVESNTYARTAMLEPSYNLTYDGILLGVPDFFTVSRSDKYYVNRPDIKGPYTQAINYISDHGYSRIGLDIGEDDWEYPIWALLKKNDLNFYMAHVNLNATNPSGRLSKNATYQAIFSTRNCNNEELVLDNVTYEKAMYYNGVAVFVPMGMEGAGE